MLNPHCNRCSFSISSFGLNLFATNDTWQLHQSEAKKLGQGMMVNTSTTMGFQSLVQGSKGVQWKGAVPR